MKKCLSLILMLCLLTVGAFAETVYQDGVAPQLVGEVAATLVDIGEREDLEDADLAAKLNAQRKAQHDAVIAKNDALVID